MPDDPLMVEARLMPRAPGWARGMIQRFLAWRDRRVGPDHRFRTIEDDENAVTELFDGVRQR